MPNSPIKYDPQNFLEFPDKKRSLNPDQKNRLGYNKQEGTRRNFTNAD